MISPNFLAARLGLGKESAKLLRAAMNRHTSYGSLHRAYAALDLANFQLRGRGVNCIRGRSQWDPYWRDVEAVYVNRGDATTLVYDCRRNIFQATTCGRWVATAERRGVKFRDTRTRDTKMTYQYGDPVEVLIDGDGDIPPAWLPGTYRGTLTDQTALPAQDRPHLVYVDGKTLRDHYAKDYWDAEASPTLRFPDARVRKTQD